MGTSPDNAAAGLRAEPRLVRKAGGGWLIGLGVVGAAARV